MTPFLRFTLPKLIKSNQRYNMLYKHLKTRRIKAIIITLSIQVGKVSKDTCGGATYKAGKSDAIGRKRLSETGVVFCTCRHGYLLRAVDMFKGETYRHVHYLHDYAYRTGSKFICYDVICKYWPFAEDISEAIEEFKFHTKKTYPFLSRWHGKTHAWYCQVSLKFVIFLLFLSTF